MALVVVVGVTAGLLGLPLGAVVILTSGVGSALFISDMNARRIAGAHEVADESLEGYPVQFPAERVAVGRLVQFRLLPPTKNVWAPGLLCFRAGRAIFAPSAPKHLARGWKGAAAEVEIHPLPGSAAVLRIHGDGGSSQFVVQRRAGDVEAALRPLVAVALRGSGPAPTQ